MKRLLIPLLAALVLVIPAIPASGLPDGPDGDVYGTGYFEIMVKEHQGAPDPIDTYSVERFSLADGWDFGDRDSYNCAWIEFFDGNTELFEVHFELVSDYPIPTIINDKYGAESDAPELLCGDGINDEDAPVLHDGSDHFPHGTGLTFSRQDRQIATFDLGLQDPNGCDKAYWTPGDEPGEAWLWWDEDGPEDLAPGEPLDCGGGPGHPVAVVRASVRNVSSGVSFCTLDRLDGGRCSGPTQEWASTVTLRLRGSLKAAGNVRVAGGPAACQRDRTVRIQRRTSGQWKRAGQDQTDASGHYALRIPAKGGRYRAVVAEQVLAGGEVCLAARSQPERMHFR